MLSKLFGRPDEEMAEYADRANRIRKIGVNLAVRGRMAFVMMTLMSSPLPLFSRAGWNPHRRIPAWGGCPRSPPRSTTRRPGAFWPR